MEFISVVLHGESSQIRFDAARTLLDYAFANYTLLTPELPAVPVELGEESAVVPLCPEIPSVVLEKGRAGDVSVRFSLPESVAAPVEQGQTLGTVQLWDGETLLSEFPLVAPRRIEKIALGQLLQGLLTAYSGGVVTGDGSQ